MVYNNRGVTYYSMGDYDKAAADYTKAIGLDGSDPITFWNRAQVYQQMQEQAKALEDYTKYLEMVPD